MPPMCCRSDALPPQHSRLEFAATRLDTAGRRLDRHPVPVGWRSCLGSPTSRRFAATSSFWSNSRLIPSVMFYTELEADGRGTARVNPDPPRATLNHSGNRSWAGIAPRCFPERTEPRRP